MSNILFKLTLFIFIFMNVLSCFSALEKKELKYENTTADFNKMILSEMATLFHRKSDLKFLPKYKVLPIATLNQDISDDVPFIRMNARTLTGNVYQLNLTPIKHNVFSSKVPMTVVWTVETTSGRNNNRTYHVIDIGGTNIKIPGDYYEDPEKMAVLRVIRNGEYNYYDGAIGESLNRTIIRPVPEQWSQYFSKSKIEHVIYKRSTDSSEDNKATPKTKNVNGDLKALYPKLLIAVDHSLFQTLGSSVEETIRYITTFWNAVNLKYKEFQNPEIKIMITGIIIAKDEAAMHYIHQSKDKKNRFIINKSSVLYIGRNYFNKQFASETGFNNYDATIVMTTLSMPGALGVTYLGAICNRPNAIAIVRDIVGDYDAVLTAAHELAHLLFVPHDDKLKDCKAVHERTQGKVHSIMTAYQKAHENVWSDCSKKILSNLANQKGSHCLKYSQRPN